jgi:hypothetical protein
VGFVLAFELAGGKPTPYPLPFFWAGAVVCGRAPLWWVPRELAASSVIALYRVRFSGRCAGLVVRVLE